MDNLCKCVGMLGGKYANRKECNRRVYSVDHCSPTLTTCGGGGQEVKIIEPVLVGGVGQINFGKQYRQGNRIYDADAVACALTAQPVGNSGGNSYLYKINEPIICAARGREPQVLTPKRTEHGKQMRKVYESGQYKESRHTMQKLEPRTDGVTNTLTTVLKDNYVLEQEDNYEEESQLSDEEEFRIQHDLDIYYQSHPSEKPKCRIRKLTPKEYFRLMGFDDNDFENAKNIGVSNSQLYKQAGNSIVVNVLMAIFSEIDFNLSKE